MSKKKNKKMNHAEKKRRYIKLSIFAVLGLILSLSIAYAALSATLTISGSGTVTASNWNIKMKKASNQNKTTGSATYTEPVINDTSVSYSVSLTKPGDSVTLYVEINNAGDVKGEISSIVNSTPTCTSQTGNTADASLVCNNLDVAMTYYDGSAIQTGDVINEDDRTCHKGDSIGRIYTILKIDIKLKDTMTAVPSSTVNISNLKHTIIYTQTDKLCNSNISCFVAGTKVLTENGYEPIETIKRGSFIYAVNLENNQYELKEVVDTIISYTDELYEIRVGDHIIETTEKHPFYVIDKEWVKASELAVGDKLSSTVGKDTTIKNIRLKKLKEKVPVYNMEVEGHHNYLITEDKYLVHNATSSLT